MLEDFIEYFDKIHLQSEEDFRKSLGKFLTEQLNVVEELREDVKSLKNLVNL